MSPFANLRLVRADATPAPGPGRATRHRRPAAWLLAGVALGALLWASASPPGALRAIPAGERAALLSRTVDELRRSCADGRPQALADHCRELATFASRFDECGGPCAELVRRELAPRPTR
ncbi:hypothetical protein [Anaeromyxobacter paludicola]|uniref:hypothetical protein n=1 Tax=Anaeromyxobacter paludicola TaxID=2918171 RepID=UPI0020BE16A7|nr:hypothetical protein [Anaeromyxobacter paludicola]